MLFDEARNFSAEGGWRPVFGRHFEGGLLLRDGANHQWHRKVVATAFKQEQLQSYLDIFARNNGALLAGWSGRSLDVYELAQQLTFANGYAAFLGRDPASATREDLLAFRYLMRAAAAVVPLPLPGTAEARAAWAKNHVEGLIRPMLTEPVAPQRTDLLANLCRMRDLGLLDDDEVMAHLIFVVAASFDTLSSGTVSTLHYLAANPEWQEAVREELCDLISEPGAIDMADLNRCERAGWAIKESLRLNSGAPVLWRRSVRPFEFGGHAFPEGTITGVNPMLTHLLPEIWDEPAQIRPAALLAGTLARPAPFRLPPLRRRGPWLPGREFLLSAGACDASVPAGWARARPRWERRRAGTIGRTAGPAGPCGSGCGSGESSKSSPAFAGEGNQAKPGGGVLRSALKGPSTELQRGPPPPEIRGRNRASPSRRALPQSMTSEKQISLRNRARTSSWERVATE